MMAYRIQEEAFGGLPLTVTLTVTAPDGTIARLIYRETVPESFWSTLWAPIDGINFRIRTTTTFRMPPASSR